MDPVVVVGGGIGGLAAAVALQRRGLPVVVLEQAPELAEVGAGLGLWPNAVRVLDALGVDVRPLGAALSLSGVRRPDGVWLQRQDPERIERRFGAPFIGVHRADLQALLAGHTAPGTVRLGARVVDLRQDPDGVDIRLDDGSAVRAGVVVGADGIRSAVRSRLVADGEPRYLGYTAWRGVTRPSPEMAAETTAFETWGRGRRFGMMPIAGRRAMWFATADAPPGGQDHDSLAAVRERFDGWHDPIPALLEATPAGSVIRSDCHDRRRAPRWTSGRVTLLGDAAHPMAPDMAQGACQAIEDAAALAVALAEGSLTTAALQDYERRRRPRAVRIVAASRWMGRSGQLGGRLSGGLRDTVVRSLPPAVALRQLDPVLGRPAPVPAGAAVRR